MTATAARSADATSDRGDDSVARTLAGTTLVVALVELVLLRLVTRTAIHIPGIEEIAGPYRVVASTGRLAFFTANVLVVVTAVAMGIALHRRHLRAEAAVVGTVLLATAATRAGLTPGTTAAVATCLAVVVLAVRVAGTDRRLGLPIGLFSGAFLAATLHAVAQDLSGSGDLGPTSTSGALAVAEVLLLAATVALAAVVRTRRRDRVVGVVTGLLVLSALVANPATTRILMLWTFGLAGYLPAPIHAVTAGLLAAAVAGALRSDRDLAIGLGLLVAGGIGLHTSYQSLLVVCGLALISMRRPGGGDDEPHGPEPVTVEDSSSP